MEHKVSTLGQEANRLCEIHADHGEQIKAKQEEIAKYWVDLTTKAKVPYIGYCDTIDDQIKLFIRRRCFFFFLLQHRKQNLDESYFQHKFLADFRDLTSWINDMKAIIQADELAKDVAGAEALLERHQEHKVVIFEIDCGKMLLE